MATKHGSGEAPRRSARGFSLLEAAIVVAIVAIVGAVALPSFTALVEVRRLDGAATRLAADVQFARSEAIARNRSLRLSIAAGADATCWVVHTGAFGDCRCSVAGVACANGAFTIRSVVLPNAEHVAVGGNVGSIVFDPLHGTSTPTGTLSLSDARGRSVRHVVNVLGRVRSCSPDRAVVGYPSC
jgi:type IV fimbrial biogenesis protein FimT